MTDGTVRMDIPTWLVHIHHLANENGEVDSSAYCRAPSPLEGHAVSFVSHGWCQDPAMQALTSFYLILLLLCFPAYRLPVLKVPFTGEWVDCAGTHRSTAAQYPGAWYAGKELLCIIADTGYKAKTIIDFG